MLTNDYRWQGREDDKVNDYVSKNEIFFLIFTIFSNFSLIFYQIILKK